MELKILRILSPVILIKKNSKNNKRIHSFPTKFYNKINKLLNQLFKEILFANLHRYKTTM